MNNPGMNNPAPTRRNCKTAVLSLLYGALLVTALVATACSNNTPPTPKGLQLKSTAEPAQIHFPGQTEQAKQLAQLRTEIREIQTTAAENRRNALEPAPTQPKTPAAPVADATTASSTRQPAATATATEPKKPQAPTATALPTPPGAVPTDNICRRNPAIQHVLINALEISSCRIITNDELFRLANPMSFNMQGPPGAGDLSGLVNIQSMSLSIKTAEGSEYAIPANTFYGMAKLNRLIISIAGEGKVTIDPGALNSLGSLKELHIKSDGILAISTNFAINLPELLELAIEAGANSHVQKNAVNNLPKLESLTISLSTSSSEGRTVRSTLRQLGVLPKLEYLEIRGRGATIQPDAFQNLPKLERLSASGYRINLDETTFQLNKRLKSISLSSSNITGIRTAFRNMEKLENLRISTSTASGDGKKPEIILSPKSPLMRDILNQERSPDGYTVVPPGGE